MTKSVFIFLVLIIAIAVAGWTLYEREQGSRENGADALITTPTPEPTSMDDEQNNEQQAGEVVTLEGGLQYQDLKVGTGQEAKAQDMVAVHYTGWLIDGTKFDSSLDRDKPFEFMLGAGMVIQGWDMGVQGMAIGGKRRLLIPSSLAYGEQGAGNGVIPPGANLVFEVELLDIQGK